jgi:hypothetical protein
MTAPGDERETVASARDSGRLTHGVLLAAAVAVPALASVMTIKSGGVVAFSWLPDVTLPALCPSRWLGLRCPSCGVTRSIVALVQGDVATSLAWHRFGWLVLALIVSQIPYRILRILRPRGRDRQLERFGVAALLVTGGVLVANWLFEATVTLSSCAGITEVAESSAGGTAEDSAALPRLTSLTASAKEVHPPAP